MVSYYQEVELLEYRDFAVPRSIFRPAPFWAINDRITPEETARQMDDMLRVGLSGGFFHSRAGMATDYMGDDWFNAMHAALDVAKEKDGYLWLYDEDLWPSGNAGGQVAGLKDEFRAAVLAPVLLKPGEAVPADSADSAFRIAYRIELDGLRLISAEVIDQKVAENSLDSERLVFFRIYEGKTGWWSGESYANLLHPEVTKEFMSRTHEVYKQRLGKDFGGRIPGIFTDEPQLHFGGGRNPGGIPWYEGIPERYNQWHDRDFWKDLPLLYFESTDSRKVRLLVHRTLLRQFCEAYSKPIFDWCESNGIAHTGHYNAEDSFVSQITNHGGSVMAHYRYQQIPGVDVLCRNAEGHLFTMKQVSSAARQLGRSRVLTEIFGVTRHTNTFQDFKWLGDYNQVLGANLFCPHLTLYTAKGRRKRDYPPNWNYQQTYWNELKPLNDYFTRLSAILSSGKAKAEVLLLHSIESGTAGHRMTPRCSAVLPGEDFGAARRYDGDLRKLLDAILNSGYECDLGDEWFIEDYGSVADGRFVIGEMSYSVVIVPPSDTWRPSTFKLLKEFKSQGGTLIFIGRPPKEIDCEDARSDWSELAEASYSVPNSRVQLQATLDKTVRAGFRLRDGEGRVPAKTYLQHRTDDGRDIWFIVNYSRDFSASYELTADSLKPLGVWNPLDGTRVKARVTETDNSWSYSFTLPPCGSILLVAGSGAVDEVTFGEAQLPEIKGMTLALPTEWEYTRSEENVIVMDRISVSVDSGATWWNEDLDHRVRRRLARHFGTSDALAWQPWVAIRKGIFNGRGGEVLLKYRFSSAVDNPRSAYIVIEEIWKGELCVNGQPVSIEGAGWHWDRNFGKVDVAGLIRKGENTVVFKVDYDFLTEVEAAYVVGDFGVNLLSHSSGEIIDEPARLTNGSWLEQGYPFYSGSITYHGNINLPSGYRRVFLRLKGASGILYKVSVNGRSAGEILWQPHILEISDYLNPEANTIEITVVSSRQNTLGPLHEVNGDDNLWVGPDAFEGEHNVREDFSLYDYGLMGGAELVLIP